MSNPRLNVRQTNVGRHYSAVQFDSSINLPSFSNGNTLSVSSDMNAVVTMVGTSTYANNNGSILVGKGASGSRIAGAIVHVDPDGFGTIQDEGTIEVLALGSNAPLVNGLCAVDGTGKVIASTAAACANAVCQGYLSSVNQNILVHQQGTISPPTSSATGPEVCVIKLN